LIVSFVIAGFVVLFKFYILNFIINSNVVLKTYETDRARPRPIQRP